MLRFVRVLAMTLIAIFTAVDACFANNNGFLPGDAYFPTVLTRAKVEEIQAADSGKRRFAYNSMGGYDFAFCGYAGYWNAQIPAIDDTFANNLARVYAKIRQVEPRELRERVTNGKAEPIETNGVRVLFYPENFNFPEHCLGLRYNENWLAEVEAFGHERTHARLCPLIPTPEAVQRSWRDARLVESLAAKLPDVERKPVPMLDSPVTIEGKVKAIIVGSTSLATLFEIGDQWTDQKSQAIRPIYIVNSNAIMQLEYYDGKWNKQDFKLNASD